jgi:hypothetical protein
VEILCAVTEIFVDCRFVEIKIRENIRFESVRQCTVVEETVVEGDKIIRRLYYEETPMI